MGSRRPCRVIGFAPVIPLVSTRPAHCFLGPCLCLGGAQGPARACRLSPGAVRVQHVARPEPPCTGRRDSGHPEESGPLQACDWGRSSAASRSPAETGQGGRLRRAGCRRSLADSLGTSGWPVKHGGRKLRQVRQRGGREAVLSQPWPSRLPCPWAILTRGFSRHRGWQGSPAGRRGRPCPDRAFPPWTPAEVPPRGCEPSQVPAGSGQRVRFSRLLH